MSKRSGCACVPIGRRAGRPERGGSRASFLARSTARALLALGAAGCIVITPEAGFERDPEVEARGRVSKNAEAVIEAFAEQQLPFATDSEIAVAPLRAGESRDWTYEAEAGATFTVVGGCDLDCLDVDLVVIDPRGAVVDRDDEPDAAPVVVTTAVEGGAYAIRVTVAACSSEPCYAAVQVLLGGAGPDYVLEVRGRLERGLEAMKEKAVSHGAVVSPLAEVIVDSAAAGESPAYALVLEGGTFVIVIAACDRDCSDVDLAIVDPGGNVLASEQEEGNAPLAAFAVPETGTYSIVVSMQSCANEPCYFGIQAVTMQPAAGARGSGSCFAVDPNGLLLTAHHVVADRESVVVILADGRRATARLEATSPATDLATLRVSLDTPDYLSLAAPRTAAVGDQVFTVGFPIPELLGEEARLASGEIGALSGMHGRSDLLQISAPVHPGSSGGPLVNARGELVGIVASTVDAERFAEQYSTFPQGLNWAVKAEYARPLFDPPPPLPPVASRADAIERTRRAVCRVVVGGE